MKRQLSFILIAVLAVFLFDSPVKATEEVAWRVCGVWAEFPLKRINGDVLGDVYIRNNGPTHFTTQVTDDCQLKDIRVMIHPKGGRMHRFRFRNLSGTEHHFTIPSAELDYEMPPQGQPVKIFYTATLTCNGRTQVVFTDARNPIRVGYGDEVGWATHLWGSLGRWWITLLIPSRMIC